jgi:CRISPR system Cascade subunit CasD
MGVRVDREGKIARDFHIAQDVYRASGGTKGSEVTVRYYLADAAFVVGLEGDFSFLTLLGHAVRQPVWQLFLGRKAFVPAEPVWLWDGLRQSETLEEALEKYPYIGRKLGPRPERLRMVVEDPSGSEVRPDVPISFEKRRFSSRRAKSLFISCPTEAQEV